MQFRSCALREQRSALLGLVLLLHALSPVFAQGGADDTKKEATTLQQSIQTERQRRQTLLDEAKALLHRRSGYIAEDTPFLATIFYSMGEPNFFSPNDQVVVDVGAQHNMKTGDRLTIFRPLDPVKDRSTGNRIGQRVQILGEAVAERVLEDMTVIRITQASYVIEIGDRVDRFGMLPPTVAPVMPSPLAKAAPHEKLGASIVSAKDEKQILAQGDVVYLDQGAGGGVVLGDRFWIFDDIAPARHPDSGERLTPPQQPLGTIRIIDVQESTATALVTQTRHEFAVGARVEYAVSAATPDRPRMEQVVTPQRPISQPAAFVEQVFPCLEQARQHIAVAEAAGASPQDLAIARNTLAYAQTTYDQAQQLKAQGKSDDAAALLATAHDDCLTAQQLAQQVGIRMAKGTPLPFDSYVVQRGSTLWDISALPTVYKDPLLWPLLYRANKDQVDDPDVLQPDQLLMVPRDYSAEEAEIAAKRARTRGPWKLGDGPDTYVLEGIRR